MVYIPTLNKNSKHKCNLMCTSINCVDIWHYYPQEDNNVYLMLCEVRKLSWAIHK